MKDNKIIKCIREPSIIILYLMSKNFLWWLDDKSYIKLKYRLMVKSKLNLENPLTFNEKLQWLKLYDRKPEYTKMVDKYEAKKYVANIIGKKYIIPTLGIYNKFEEIDFEKLPDKFVIKPTHTSGDIFVCKDKNEIDYKKLKKEVKKWLKRKYYYLHREWPYKNIKPRIIIEEYMENESKEELKDYKIFCFNSEPKVTLVCSNRFQELKETFFDNDWKELDVTEGGHEKEKNIQKPINFEKMKELAKILSNNIPAGRIDLYEINGQIYFGEITIYPKSGYEEFSDERYNVLWGNWIQLPKT